MALIKNGFVVLEIISSIIYYCCAQKFNKRYSIYYKGLVLTLVVTG